MGRRFVMADNTRGTVILVDSEGLGGSYFGHLFAFDLTGLSTCDT